MDFILSRKNRIPIIAIKDKQLNGDAFSGYPPILFSTISLAADDTF